MFIVTAESMCPGCGEAPVTEEVLAPDAEAAKMIFAARFPMYRITKIIKKS